jgi:Tol biopolymer transport system component
MRATPRTWSIAIALLVAVAGRAGAQPLAPINVASDGTQSNGFSYHPSVSADDRFAAYDSTASNLVAGDTNGVSDIFVYDSLTRTTTRESVGSGGTQADGNATFPAISGNGRFVAFSSSATNLVPGVGGSQVYVRDRQANITIAVSVSTAGIPGNGASGGARISADGRYVMFSSNADNLVPGDTNGLTDAFTRDLLLGTTTRESLAADGTQSAVGGFGLSMSGDGRSVAFFSNGGIFVRDRSTGAVTAESVGPEGQPVLFAVAGSLSADGRILAFSTRFGDVVDVYVRDRTARQTAIGFHSIGHVSAAIVSADARFVAFASAPLGGGQASVSVLDRANGRVTRIGAMSQSYLTMETPAIGTAAIAFSSEFALTPFDTNSTIDIYGGRVTDAAAPGTPTGLSAAVTGSTVVLTWNASASGGPALGYIIEAGSSSGAANLANFSTGTSAPSYTAVGVGAGTYYVRVRAVGAAGPSDASNEIVVVVTPVCIPPSPAGSLTPIVAGSTVTLTWTAGTNAATYVLEAGSASGQSDVIVADLGSAATTVTANNVGPGRYFVRVRSKNTCGISGVSNEAVVEVR